MTLSPLAKQTRWMDAVSQAELVRSGQISASELLESTIERVHSFNPQLNAINIMWLDQAREFSDNYRPNQNHKFGGVPFVLKDLGTPFAGQQMSNGNIALKNANYVAPTNSLLTQKLIDSGLNIFGRGNSPEFGSMPVTEPLAWGPTRSPLDLARTPGGSSGGSAAAVAAGIVPMAQGGDGAGSIRIPASCCGLVGLKPSQGRISLAPSGDEANISVKFGLTRTVRDTALLLDALHGPGVGDRFIAPPPRRDYIQEVKSDPGQLRIGFIDHHPNNGHLEDECRNAARFTSKLLETLGHKVENAWPRALTSSTFGKDFTTIWAANMSVSIHSLRKMIGREVNSSDVEPMNWAMAEYARRKSAKDLALAIARLVDFRRNVCQWWADGWDLLVTPTLTKLPLPIGAIKNSAENPLRALRIAGEWIGYTAAFNVTGQPAINIPVYWTSDGIPVGIQLVAAFGREDLLIQVAAQLETAAPWAQHTPSI